MVIEHSFMDRSYTAKIRYIFCSYRSMYIYIYIILYIIHNIIYIIYIIYIYKHISDEYKKYKKPLLETLL